MGHRSTILQEELVQAAHALASGRRQAHVAEDFAWDTNKMRRCVARMSSEVQVESERKYWPTVAGTALEWLRLRNLCTPDELDNAKAMARQEALKGLERTLMHGERLRQWGIHEDAEHWYLRYLRDDPSNVEVLVALGYCFMEMGRLGDALERFRAVFLDNPECAIPHFEKLARSPDQREVLKEFEEARRLAPDNNVHILALLGNWLMGKPTLSVGTKSSPGRVAVVQMLNEAIMTLVQRHAGKDRDLHRYCINVVEIVLSGLWEHGYTDEAVGVARTAEQHGWNTFCVDAVLKSVERRYLFSVLAQASSEERPGHWPNNSVGYILKVDVVAKNADEARTAALEYMQRAEPSSVHFQIDVHQQEGEQRSAVGTSVFMPGRPLWFYQNAGGPPTTEPPGVTSVPSRDPLPHRRAQTRRRAQATTRRRH